MNKKGFILLAVIGVLMMSCEETRTTVILPSSIDSSPSSESTSIVELTSEEILRRDLKVLLTDASINFTASNGLVTIYQNENYQATSFSISDFTFTSGLLLLSDNLWHEFTMNDVSDTASLNVTTLTSESSPTFIDLSHLNVDEYLYDADNNELIIPNDGELGNIFGPLVNAQSENLTHLTLGINDEGVMTISSWNDTSRTIIYDIYDINMTTIEALENYLLSGEIPTSDFALNNFISSHFGNSLFGPNYTLSAQINETRYSVTINDDGTVIPNDEIISETSYQNSVIATEDALHKINQNNEVLLVNNSNHLGYLTYQRNIGDLWGNSIESTTIQPYYMVEDTFLLASKISDEEYQTFLDFERILTDVYSLKSDADINTNAYYQAFINILFNDVQEDVTSMEINNLSIITNSLIAPMMTITIDASQLIESEVDAPQYVEKNITCIYSRLGSSTINVEEILVN